MEGGLHWTPIGGTTTVRIVAHQYLEDDSILGEFTIRGSALRRGAGRLQEHWAECLGSLSTLGNCGIEFRKETSKLGAKPPLYQYRSIPSLQLILIGLPAASRD